MLKLALVVLLCFFSLVHAAPTACDMRSIVDSCSVQDDAFQSAIRDNRSDVVSDWRSAICRPARAYFDCINENIHKVPACRESSDFLPESLLSGLGLELPESENGLEPFRFSCGFDGQ